MNLPPSCESLPDWLADIDGEACFVGLTLNRACYESFAVERTDRYSDDPQALSLTVTGIPIDRGQSVSGVLVAALRAWANALDKR